MTKRLAIMFDLDGTLVDTETIHAEAESKLLNGFGVNITPEEISRKYAGVPTEDYIEKIVNFSSPLDELLLKKNQIINDLLEKKGIHPIQGMPELVKCLSDLNIPIFIVSSSSLKWIRKCLDVPFQINGEDHSYGEYFNFNFISCSEVQKSKPAPDVFLEAKKRMQKRYNFLKSDNTRWIAIGDSVTDMQGALNASMKALVLWKFEDEFVKNDNVAVFSNSEKLIAYIDNMVMSVE